MVRKQFHTLFTLLLATTLVTALLVLCHYGVSNAASADPTDDGQPYVVQPGDSLYKISGDFYGDPMAWPSIVEATNAKAAQDKSFAAITNPSTLRVGQKLWLPKSATTTTARKSTTTTTPVKVVSAGTERVFFEEPQNGATVPPNFTIKMAATGLKVEPSGQIHEGAGHMHILVDTDFVPAGDVIINDAEHLHFGKGQLTTPITLTPGIHVLRLQFANGAHVALDGPQYRDTITVTVASTATGATTAQAGVRFVEPLNGATVPPNFTVKMEATGLKVEPSGQIHEGAGHMHILVDTDFVPAGDVIINDAEHLHFGKGQLTTPITLTPGIHVLHLQFANGAHVALDGPQYRDTITVTVASTATATTPSQAGVHFVEPLNGATVPPNFTVKMEATGLKVEPSGQIHTGAGHMHILVDTDFVPAGDVIINDAEHLHFGKGQLTTPITLTPGIHVLRLQFANGAHVALDGPQYRDTITVTVASTATGATPSQAGVRFVEPLNGATVPPNFTIKMAATGLKVEPSGQIHTGAGHMHILVDTDFVPAGDVIINDAEHLHFGKGQLTTPITLTPGIHVLRLQFANGAHVALDGPQYRDTITVTVASTATGATPSQAGVRFVEPLNGATVPPNFTIKMAATGLKVEPSGQIHTGAGHMHILVDTDFVPAGDVIINDAEHLHFGKGQLTTPITLTPGIHVLRLQFANGAHVALDGPQYRDTITVTVASTATGATPSQAGVRFVEPLNGATVPPNFTVKMEATGLKVEPSGQIHTGAGHMHILVDTDFVPAGDVIINDAEHLHFGKGQLTTPITLTPGIHVLRLQFANGAHVALDGPQYRDTITVTIASTATGTTPSQAGVRFVEPRNGATVPPNFTVKMEATGLKVEPSGQIHEGAGHMHILVDTDFVPAGDVIINDAEHLHFGKGQLTTPITLTPGIHVLNLQFANGAHVALDGPQYRDTITVTVKQ